jgi:hypothetical protein
MTNHKLESLCHLLTLAMFLYTPDNDPDPDRGNQHYRTAASYPFD